MALINEGTGTMIGGGDFGMNLGTSAGIPAVPVTTPIATPVVAPVTTPVAQPLATETLPQGTFYGQQATVNGITYEFSPVGWNPVVQPIEAGTVAAPVMGLGGPADQQFGPVEVDPGDFVGFEGDVGGASDPSTPFDTSTITSAPAEYIAAIGDLSPLLDPTSPDAAAFIDNLNNFFGAGGLYGPRYGSQSYGNYQAPVVGSDPTYGSGLAYAQQIAVGMPISQVIAPGVSYSPERPMGYTQADIPVPPPFAGLSQPLGIPFGAPSQPAPKPPSIGGLGGGVTPPAVAPVVGGPVPLPAPVTTPVTTPAAPGPQYGDMQVMNGQLMEFSPQGWMPVTRQLSAEELALYGLSVPTPTPAVEAEPEPTAPVEFVELPFDFEPAEPDAVISGGGAPEFLSEPEPTPAPAPAPITAPVTEPVPLPEPEPEPELTIEDTVFGPNGQAYRSAEEAIQAGVTDYITFEEAMQAGIDSGIVQAGPGGPGAGPMGFGPVGLDPTDLASTVGTPVSGTTIIGGPNLGLPIANPPVAGPVPLPQPISVAPQPQPVPQPVPLPQPVAPVPQPVPLPQPVAPAPSPVPGTGFIGMPMIGTGGPGNIQFGPVELPQQVMPKGNFYGEQKVINGQLMEFSPQGWMPISGPIQVPPTFVV
jgi:hypothetical protein